MPSDLPKPHCLVADGNAIAGTDADGDQPSTSHPFSLILSHAIVDANLHHYRNLEFNSHSHAAAGGHTRAVLDRDRDGKPKREHQFHS